MRTYKYRFCPTCETRRIMIDYRCAVCGGPVRLRPVRLNGEQRVTARARTEAPRPVRLVGWHGLAAARAEQAKRAA